MNQTDDALQWFRQALATDQEHLLLEPCVSAAETYLALGEHEQARDYALKAYAQAWADGPPYRHWWEQTRSWRVLQALGETDEQAIQQQLGLTPFDPSKVEKIPHEDEIIAFIEELEARRSTDD